MQRRTWILAAMLLVFTACDSESTTEEETSIVGTYTVQTINGHTLPYNNPSGEIQTSGTLVLRADNTYTVSLQGQFAGGGSANFTETGTYTYTNGDLALTSPEDGAVTHGVFTGTTLTVNGDDGIYVLKKN